MAKDKQIGNPAIIAAASAVANTSIIDTAKKVTKIGAIGTGIAVGSFLLYKGGVLLRRNALLNKAAGDLHVYNAIKIWDAIPDGYKNKWSILTFLNPISTATSAYDEIATLWQDTNTQRIMAAAKSIYDNGLKVDRVSRNFKTLYRIDMLTLLNKVLKPQQIDVFINLVTKGSGSTKPAVAAGQLALVKVAVHLRSEPTLPAWYEKTNVVRSAPPRYIAGQATGREETFTEGDTSVVFVELMAYDSSVSDKKYSTPVWAWKGALDFYPADQLKKIYGNLQAIDVKQGWTDLIINNIGL